MTVTIQSFVRLFHAITKAQRKQNILSSFFYHPSTIYLTLDNIIIDLLVYSDLPVMLTSSPQIVGTQITESLVSPDY